MNCVTVLEAVIKWDMLFNWYSYGKLIETIWRAYKVNYLFEDTTSHHKKTGSQKLRWNDGVKWYMVSTGERNVKMTAKCRDWWSLVFFLRIWNTKEDEEEDILKIVCVITLVFCIERQIRLDLFMSSHVVYVILYVLKNFVCAHVNASAGRSGSYTSS